MEGREGQLGTDPASTQLREPGAFKQWVASKQQAVDSEHGLLDTHTHTPLAFFHVCAPFSALLLVSRGVSHARGRAAQVPFPQQQLNS